MIILWFRHEDGSLNADHLKLFYFTDGHTHNSDEFSDFKRYLKCTKNTRNRGRKRASEITLQDLKSIWINQEGICPLTGWKLKLRTHTNCSKEPLTPYCASVDRIDNSKGYIKGNIRFISVMANYARNIFSDEEVIDFCKSVAINSTLV